MNAELEVGQLDTPSFSTQHCEEPWALCTSNATGENGIVTEYFGKRDIFLLEIHTCPTWRFRIQFSILGSEKILSKESILPALSKHI